MRPEPVSPLAIFAALIGAAILVLLGVALLTDASGLRRLPPLHHPIAEMPR